MRTFSIREFSNISGLSPYTLRYYEKIGLLGPVPRKATGYREYTDDNLRQVEFLKRLRDTGMSIQGMMEYALLRAQGDSTLTQRRELLERHGREVEGRIREQESHLQAIRWKIDWYKNEEARRSKD